MTVLLHTMLEELQNYKECDRATLMAARVAERLEKSFNQYDTELQQSIQFLTKKHEKSLIKRMNKLNGKSS